MNLHIPSLATLLCGALFAAEPAERELVFKDAKKEQIRHSMIGIRDTILFYTFAEKGAVLVVNIDGKATMPVSATVHLFPPGTSAEDLGKWINNQHSDGLFPEVPVPTHSIKLPEATCSVIDRESVGQEKSPINEDIFADYKVKLTVKEHREEGKFHLHAFADEAGVFVKIETS
jgi:hypothetical protein